MGSPPCTLLLVECRCRCGTEIVGDAMLARLRECPTGRFVGGRGDSILVDCEPFLTRNGTLVRSLLVRPYYFGTGLDEALDGKTPVHVVAFWRRFGFPWTPRSVRVAERFGLGVGGSMTATLVPLSPEP